MQTTQTTQTKPARGAKNLERHTVQVVSWNQYNATADAAWGFGSCLLKKADGTGWGNSHLKFNGSIYGIKPGDQIVIEGALQQSEKYGEQFKVTQWHPDKSPESGGLAIYLANLKSLRGLGQSRAARLVELYRDAESIAAACESQPDAVAAAIGISTETAANIAATLREESILVDTRAWLSSCGLTINQITKLVEHFGWETRSAIESCPYRAIGVIDGFGFSRADEIALKTNIPEGKNNHDRIRYGLKWVLSQENKNGHTYTAASELFSAAKKALALDCMDFKERIRTALSELVESKDIILSQRSPEAGGDGIPRYAMPDAYAAEREIMLTLRNFANIAPENPNFASLVSLQDDYFESHYPELNAEQREAVANAFKSRISIISGAAGSGKTYSQRTIVAIAEDAGMKVALCSPTGKAANRLEKSTGHEASTVHRLLSYNPESGFYYTKWCKLPYDLVIVDETSMMDVYLLQALFEAIDFKTTALVMVGDHNQLPPVDAGYPFRDIIVGALVPATQLRTVIRQAGDLKANSVAILDGIIQPQRKKTLPDEVLPWYVFTDSKTLRCDPQEVIEVEKFLLRLLEHSIPACGFDIVRDVQVLTPMRAQRDALVTSTLNRRIQRLVQRVKYGVQVAGPDDTEPLPELDERGKKLSKAAIARLKKERRAATKPAFMVGDKVIQTKNNYDIDVMNGTIGYVTSVLEKGALIVAFDSVSARDGGSREVELTYAQTKNLELAYALTTHKAQGSEFPCVIVVCHSTHSHMLNRNWLYTAVTRAQRCCVIVGNNKGVRRALDCVDSEKRRTFLSLAGVAGK